ncbi:MAG: SDR family NAD(P)-dependent oxidoreductase [Magnetospiraceae bacterium]
METKNQPTALVTGAAAGIGWATASLFAARGYRVAIADLAGDKAAEQAAELGASHRGFACNVTDEDAVQATVGAVLKAFGRLDVVVNNAGIGDTSAPTLEQTGDHFQRVLSVHLQGTFLMSRIAAQAMIDAGRPGAIVNIAPIAGFVGLPRRNAYGAAKAGIVAMTKSMGSEWGARSIRVNAVAPGYVQTALVDKLIADGLLDGESITKRTPLGRFIQPREIAEAVCFLASPAASAITGTTLLVDAGWTAFGAAGDPSGAPT